tara:strand:+ start:313 stop:495 length:183 start_codon:yes stop_codon:yes gene_type:complete
MTMNEYTLLYAMLKDLKLIQEREDKRHEMDAHLVHSTYEVLGEIICLLETELNNYEDGYQ